MSQAVARASLIFWMAGRLLAQSTPAVKAFEVASVRPHDGPMPAMGVSTKGPRLNGLETVRGLIMYAYNLKNYQVIGPPEPNPVGDTFYDVVAKAEGDVFPTKAEFQRMLQLLLADRFRVQVHREMREMPVYALVVGKSGAKLKQSASDAAYQWNLHVKGRNYEVTMTKASMDDLITGIASSFPSRPVVDRTGLTGTYDAKITYTPDVRSNRTADPDPNDISIFTAVQEQLGLKLEPLKAMIEVLVVDRVEKPSAN